MKNKSKALLGLAGAGALTGAALFTEELYRYMFCRGSSPLFEKLFDSKGHCEEYYQWRDEAAQRLRQAPHEEYTIRSARANDLRGYYYPCGSGGKTVAFLVHGYRSSAMETGGMFYDYYKSRGIDFFCADHTASGGSQGHFIGFDVFETQDCLMWLDFLRCKCGEDVQIILHGFSMGAATVMQMSSHCPPNVKFIVEDSGYRSAKASLWHQVGPMYGPMRMVNRVVAGYDLKDSDVTESLAASRIPMLFVHGQEDKLVPFENGPMLYDLYQGPKASLFAPDTRHIETMFTSPEAYAQKLDAMVSAYIQK